MSKFTQYYPRALFIGLDTYRLIGGLQAFNRRVVSNIASIYKEVEAPSPHCYFMGDQQSDFPAISNVHLKGFGRNRGAFIARTLKTAANADLLLVGHLNLVPVAALARLLNPKIRIVLFAHGDEVWGGALRPKLPYEQLLLKVVDTVAAVSQYTANVMSAAYRVPQSRYVVFPNAVDDIPDKAPYSTRDPHTVLCVTRVGASDRLKNVDALIRAMAIVIQTMPQAKLELVGEGVLRPELEALAMSLGIHDNIRFHGRAPGTELAAAYERASVFALPSSKEGFGIVYLEAWQRRIPVVCGTKGAPHEIVSHNVDGFVVDETHDQDIANRLLFLLENPLIASEMGNAGFNKVKDNYLNTNAKINLNELIKQ